MARKRSSSTVEEENLAPTQLLEQPLQVVPGEKPGLSGEGKSNRKHAPQYCRYCRKKEKLDHHQMTACSLVNATTRSYLSWLHFCLDCHYQKDNNKGLPHKCPNFVKEWGQFCNTCKSICKLCVNPTLHQAVKISDRFASAALDTLNNKTAVLEDTMDTSIWSQEPSFAMAAKRGALSKGGP